MRNTLRGGVLAVALALGSAGAVHADWNPPSLVYGCGGSGFETCLSGVIAMSGSQLTLTVVNEDNVYNSVFMGVGFLNLPGSAELSLASVTIDGDDVGDMWGDPAEDLNGGWDPYDGVYGAKPDNQPPEYGVMYGQTAVFTFDILNGAQDIYVDALGIAVHAISGPNGCSTKLGVFEDGETIGVGSDYGDSCVSVPEPMSGGLIAAGLVGLIAVRRRRGGEIVEED